MKSDDYLKLDGSTGSSELEWQALDLSNNEAWQNTVQITQQQFLQSLKPENIDKVDWNGVAREGRPKSNYTEGKANIGLLFKYMRESYIPEQVLQFESAEIGAVDYLKSIFNNVRKSEFFSTNNAIFDSTTLLYMEIAFSEGRKIIDFCIDSQIPREDAWILNTTSKFLYAKVGSRHMPEAAEDIDPNAVRTHLLNQRIFSLTNRGAVERHGLDSYLGTAGYKKHCPAPTDQIKEAVYIVSSTFYHFYPLLQKRYLDIQKKENY